MASVDSRVTATTTVSVNRSPWRSRGSTAEMASAAEAPQIATAPPHRTLCPRVMPRRRPSTSANASVRTIATTTVSAVVQPNATICCAVMRAPSSPTPNRSTVRLEKSMPRRVMASWLRWCSATPNSSAYRSVGPPCRCDTVLAASASAAASPAPCQRSVPSATVRRATSAGRIRAAARSSAPRWPRCRGRRRPAGRRPAPAPRPRPGRRTRPGATRPPWRAGRPWCRCRCPAA